MVTKTSTEEIRALLNPAGVSLEALLKARAIPNQRLASALGITSTFVSSDPHVHDNFTRTAKSLISAVNPKEDWDGWFELMKTMEACIDHCLPQQHSADYATFMQTVTFSTIVVGLLGADITAIDPHDVAFVTRSINERWTLSKTNPSLPPGLLEEINKHIFRWVPDRDKFPVPLNYIIPAYETMWRVVGIAMVYAQREEVIRQAFLDFGDNPTVPQFEAFKLKPGPSVEAVIREVLRLHPPTKHISRIVEVPACPFAKVVAEVADIETVQRTQTYGEDAGEFNPMRYHPNAMELGGDRPFFAFGYGKLKCVAASWAPMAAGLLVAKIFERIDDITFGLTEGPAIGGREGWEGWSIDRKDL
ncbi:cytochrome P450 [Hygrophoropsis aurantiaca]|uniref:Cytochrome P450 n=1 Tax=Hygrophoropsis aurantiaca TaxID=72124 RepID=A0ACB8AFG7_9AGAM|nr:cytochrome P450 [Hygrophoropsis aurantiaca]